MRFRSRSIGGEKNVVLSVLKTFGRKARGMTCCQGLICGGKGGVRGRGRKATGTCRLTSRCISPFENELADDDSAHLEKFSSTLCASQSVLRTGPSGRIGFVRMRKIPPPTNRV